MSNKSTDNSTATYPRDWSWHLDGDLDGRYVETRLVDVREGPSAGQTKPVVTFDIGDEQVSVWPNVVLSRMFREELELRGKSEFEPNERIRITVRGKRPNRHGGTYWDFADVVFEHAAPRPPKPTTAADIFATVAVEEDEPVRRDLERTGKSDLDGDAVELAPAETQEVVRGQEEAAEAARTDDDIPF